MMVFLHVLFMFMAVALTAGPGIMLSLIADSGDPKAISAAGRAMRPLGMIGGISLLIGVLLGFGTASEMGFPLASTWLVVTYVCVVLILVIGITVHQPWAMRLGAAAAAGDTAKLQAVAHEPFPRLAGPLTGILWIIIIAMMTLKP